MDIICDLLIGVWNFLYSKTQWHLEILYDFYNIFEEHDTKRPFWEMIEEHK